MKKKTYSSEEVDMLVNEVKKDIHFGWATALILVITVLAVTSCTVLVGKDVTIEDNVRVYDYEIKTEEGRIVKCFYEPTPFSTSYYYCNDGYAYPYTEVKANKLIQRAKWEE